ncbi:MAG: hypothetical protein ACYDAC_04950 [Candidatus Dormibacteria bacterium]
MRVQARRRVAIGAVIALVGGVATTDILLATVGHAQRDDSQAANYSLYGGEVAATADREQVGSTIDAGFTAGLVNNFYPLARVAVAIAGTSAAASPADTGPLAQAVFAGQNVNQPQYVFAQSPGNPTPPGYAAGPATASASALPYSATAAATYGAAGTTTTAPPTSNPDGMDSGTASDSSYFDSSLGFVTVGDSRVQRASYGAGTLVIDNVHVAVQVSTTGAAFTKSIVITVGGAYVTVAAPAPVGQVLRIPVSIGQDGVTAAGPLVPGGPLQDATSQANAALAAAGLSVHTVAPLITQNGTDLHVEAVGVVVNQQNIGGVSGVPNQFVIHTLGEVVLDNEAVAGSSQADLGNILGVSGDTGTSSGVSTSTNTVVSGTTPVGAGGGTSSRGSRTVGSAAPLSALVTHIPPRWLLLAYLAWQCLMLALAGSLYLQRMATRRTA